MGILARCLLLSAVLGLLHGCAGNPMSPTRATRKAPTPRSLVTR